MSDSRRIEAFLEMMSAERGAAMNTLDAYARDLADASAHLEGDLIGADAHALQAYLRSLAARGLAPATAARKLSALRRFYRFLFEEATRGDDPTAGLMPTRKGRTLPDVLSREEVVALIEASADDTRLACLLELLYGAGLRASEVVALPMGALPRWRAGRWETGELRIRGKGGRERVCPLGRPGLDALAAWLTRREASLPQTPAAAERARAFVFPSRGKAGHLTRRRLAQMLEALAPKAGLAPERVHPHALRHAYATHLLQGGADLRSVQTLLGHADISTTEIYTHVMSDALAELLETAHPLSDAH